MTSSRRDPVLVIGATGRIGRLVVDELLRTHVQVRALTRQPERASLPANVEVVAGDLTNPESVGAALEGVGAVFLLWTAPVASAPEVIARIARHAERRRVVYLSAPFRTPHPFFQQPNPMRAVHEELERLLVEAELATTILRPGMFASNVLHWWAPQIRAGNIVRWPYADIETAPIDERDVAAVAARALADDRHANMDYVLTGPESLTQRAQLNAIGDAIGRPLVLEELSAEQFRRETAGVWPEGVANMLLSAWDAAQGHLAFVTSAVQEVLGVPARTFRAWAVENGAAFGRDPSLWAPRARVE